MSGRLSFNNSPSFKGFIFQFLVALERCFEMKQGQFVYIETYGDVSIMGNLLESEQIESKFYKRNLTDLDSNIWNTINNWMNEDFPLEKFSALVLLTTQKISTHSLWLNWNSKSNTDKLATFLKFKKYTSDGKGKISQKLRKIFDNIFDSQNESRLKKIINMFYLDNVTMDEKSYIQILQDKYAKCIPNIQKERFIYQLYGFVLRPEIIGEKWEISYRSFADEVENITKQLIETTTRFPAKIQLGDIDEVVYESDNFVQKIHAIDYDEEIPNAIMHYEATGLLIEQMIRNSCVMKDSLNEYKSNLEDIYRPKYNKASRNYNQGEIISASKDFYDDIMGSDGGTFHIYNSVPNYFYNGMLHILANEKDNIVWLLKEKKHE